MLTHDNLASNALTLIDYWRSRAADVLIHALPIYHTHGLFVATNMSLLSGAHHAVPAEIRSDDVIEADAWRHHDDGRADLLYAPPPAPAEPRATAHMRLFVSGSAPLLADTHREFRERTGHAILERYGMTETNMNTSNPYDGERIAGTVGFPLAGVSCASPIPRPASRWRKVRSA
jgi:malonyl-CoA/methylmalonyl-CoA synthetase